MAQVQIQLPATSNHNVAYQTRAHRHLPLHLPRPPVTSQYARPGTLHHLGILDRLVDILEYPELGSDGDREVSVQDIDCAHIYGDRADSSQRFGFRRGRDTTRRTWTHSSCRSYPNHPARNSHNSLSLRYPADSHCVHHHHHRNQITEPKSAFCSSSHPPAFERTRGVKGRTHKLISTASQCFSTSFAACNSTSGSLAANCSRAHNDDDGQYSGEGTKKEGFVSPCIHSRLKHTFRTGSGVDRGEEENRKIVTCTNNGRSPTSSPTKFSFDPSSPMSNKASKRGTGTYTKHQLLRISIPSSPPSLPIHMTPRRRKQRKRKEGRRKNSVGTDRKPD
jgi:hypothetical protein